MPFEGVGSTRKYLNFIYILKEQEHNRLTGGNAVEQTRDKDDLDKGGRSEDSS
jgi:hypothetical protein